MLLDRPTVRPCVDCLPHVNRHAHVRWRRESAVQRVIAVSHGLKFWSFGVRLCCGNRRAAVFIASNWHNGRAGSAASSTYVRSRARTQLCKCASSTTATCMRLRVNVPWSASRGPKVGRVQHGGAWLIREMRRACTRSSVGGWLAGWLWFVQCGP